MTEMFGRWAQAPDLIEPIIGYRAWPFQMSDRGVHLLSFVSSSGATWIGGDWEGSWRGWVNSSCPLPGRFHLAPDEGCTCGFYATKARDESPSLLAVMLAQEANDSTGTNEAKTGAVFGRVDLAGKVIEHELGYRAERARIAELIPTTTDGGITELVAARLDLPVGSAVDGTAALEDLHQTMRSRITSPQPRRLGPVDRMRLKTHRRHFRVIPGERSPG
jgi:hypothetical protein